MLHESVTPERISSAQALIRPHIRRTPVMQVDLGDFGGPALPVALKLELLQHSGSFRPAAPLPAS